MALNLNTIDDRADKFAKHGRLFTHVMRSDHLFNKFMYEYDVTPLSAYPFSFKYDTYSDPTRPPLVY